VCIETKNDCSVGGTELPPARDEVVKAVVLSLPEGRAVLAAAAARRY